MKLEHWGWKKVALVGGILAAVLLVVGFFAWHRHNQAGTSNPQATANRIITKVGKLYELPTNEQPTVIRVQDVSQLKNRAFFDKARNGDYTLVYASSKLAILYREPTNKIITAMPVSLGNNTPSTTPQAANGAAKN
jgi:hypothetical protein